MCWTGIYAHTKAKFSKIPPNSIYAHQYMKTVILKLYLAVAKWYAVYTPYIHESGLLKSLRNHQKWKDWLLADRCWSQDFFLSRPDQKLRTVSKCNVDKVGISTLIPVM